MVALLEFLSHVLPPEGQGLRCAVAIRDKQIRGQILCETNAQLEYLLRGMDKKGSNAFLACSSFTNAKVDSPRSQGNVAFVKSFWLDIDAGVGKPYVDYQEAKAAVLEFAEATNLPIPTLVCSGNGVHAWWTLETSITGLEWTKVAKELKRLTSTHNLRADNARTSDRSSVLRPIGTRNLKDNNAPKEVYLDGDLQPVIPNNIFMDKVLVSGIPSGLEFGSALDTDILGGLSSSAPQEPSYALLARERCGQLRDFEQLHGNVEEPLWYANLGVLAHCQDGERFAQEWSSGHPNYSAVETQQKLEQARTRAGPTTCDRFKSLNPVGCKGCPFSVTSPIQLGKKEDMVTPPKIEPPRERKMWLPEDFVWGQNYEILTKVRDPNSTPEEPKFLLRKVCPFPFQIEAVRIEETHGVAGDQSVLISKRTPHSPWTSFTAKQGDLYASNMASVLAAKGVVCAPGMEKQFKKLVHGMIEGVTQMRLEDVCYNSFGWKKNRTQFVAGRKMYTNSAIATVSGTEEFEKRADKLQPHPSGDLNMWRSLANKLFAPGCEAQAVALLCSFAAPLMDLMFSNSEGGGILSLVSHGSGRGKSTALAAVESVWGTPTCLRITEAASIAAKFRSIGLFKNLPVVIDEWGSSDAEVTRELCTIFTGGLDKDRLTQHGLSINERLTWKTILIGSTNRPMREQLQGAGDPAQANRIFEIPIVVPDYVRSSHGASLEKNFEKCCGLAGPVFISHLLRNYNLEDLEARANTILEAFVAKLKVPNDYRFNLRIVAACAIVAQILATPDKETGEPMLSFTPSTTIQYMLDIIKTDAANKESKTSYEEMLTDFIRDNTHDFVVVEEPFNAKKPTQLYNKPSYHALKGRYEKSIGRILIPSSIMRKFALKSKVPYSEFCTALMASGVLLQRNRMSLLSAGVEGMTPIKLPCWEIDATHDAIGGDMTLFEDFQPHNPPKGE